MITQAYLTAFPWWPKKHRFRGLLLICCLGLSVSLIHGQVRRSPQYRVVHWDTDDGLTLGYKNAMIRDRNGFLWVTSPAGLNRFDGNYFQHFFSGEQARGSIPGSYFFSIVEDSLHRLWMGTNRGLLVYHADTDSFQSIRPGGKGNPDITTIVPFHATKTAVYCVESAQWITAYDTRTLQRKLLATLPPNPFWRNAFVMAVTVLDEQSNTVWLVDGQKEGALLQVSLADGRTQRHSWGCMRGDREHMHYTEGICLDPARRLIWINSDDGLLCLNLRTSRFEQEGILRIRTNEKLYRAFPGISLAPDGGIWFSSNLSGLQVYHPGRQTLHKVDTDIKVPQLISESLMRIFFDKDSMVWLGYANKKGMNQLLPYTTAVRHYGAMLTHMDKPGPDRVHNITQGAGVDLWMGTSRGMFKFNTDTETFTPWQDGELGGADHSLVLPLGTQAGTNLAWFYHEQERRVFEVDMVTRKRRNIVLDQAGTKASSYYVFTTYSKLIQDGLLLQVDEDGIYFLQTGDTVAVKIASIPHHVTNVAVAGNRYVFARTHLAGRNVSVTRQGKDWRRVETPIDSLEWNCIAYDETDGSFWVGGISRLYHFDAGFRLMKKYMPEDGIPGLGLLAILLDNAGRIWFNTAEGRISCLDPRDGSISYLTRKDGYQGNSYFWQIPYVKDQAGDIYFAGEKGIDRIRPGAIRDYNPPTAYIRSVSVAGKILRGLGGSAPLMLRKHQRQLVVETGIIDFHSEGEDFIRYRMVGLDSNWQIAPANHAIRFEQVPPGTYQLVLQAARSGYRFNGPETIFRIRILPAVWDTLAFKFVSALVAGLLLFFLIRYSVRLRYKAKLERSEKEGQLAEMAQQTAELQQRALALEMQALRAQMNPHFIFNSLNAINRFILQNDRKQASEYLSKFSRLVRLILENSKETMISLSGELEALKLYLELESLRFENRFRYKISIPAELEESEPKLPPLIIQPFAENAIWHGLMQKPEMGQLDIEISSEKDHLYIRVADNGIGRKQAAMEADSATVLHKSMGQQITMERIALLGKRESANATVVIHDLVDPEGKGAGTEVIIQIPLIYD